MAEYDLARAMVRQMAAWGVKVIYGVTGDDILPFLDALAREGSIRYIGSAHEAGAAFMASYQAKYFGGLGVCVASAAGAVNLAEGLADAYMDGAPVLALTGQVATSRIGTQAKQYFHQQGLLGNFAAYSELVTDAPGALRLLIRAMSQAQQKQTVAHLSIPLNLWSQSLQAEPGMMPTLASASVGQGYLLGDIARTVGLMRQARKPLVLVGKKGRGITRGIQEMVSAWGAAVVVAQEAKGVVPNTWPEVLGGIGEAWVPALVPDCDCILLIGSASYEEKFLPKVPVIQIETQSWQVSDVYLWDSLAGDIQYIIKTLTQELKGYQPDAAWQGRITADKNLLLKMLEADAQNDSRPVHPARLMSDLNRLVAGDAVITLDEGAFTHWFDRNFQTADQQILLSSRWRSMGAGLSAAIAAKACQPEKQVVAVVGDGGLLMSLGELTTAVKHQLPITVVVVNNSLYGLEKDKTLAKGLLPLGLETQAPDFSRYAQACGAQGFRVEDPKQLEETLSRALALQTPALVDVVCADARLPNLG